MARYGKKAASKVRKAMHERKKGSLKSGRSGKTVKSRKQAIAIGLSEARRSGAKVPKKRSAGGKKTAARKGPAKKSAARKPATKKASAKKAASARRGGRASSRKTKR